MGRHGDGTVYRPWWVKPLFTFVVGAILFGAGIFVVSRFVSTPTPASEAGLNPRQKCDSVAELSIAVTPALADVVTKAAQTAGQGTCTDFTVTAQESAATAKEYAEGRGPDLWVPDSSAWADQVALSQPKLLTTGNSLATSPLVLAYGSGKAPEAATWADLATQGRMQVADLQTSTPSRLALAGAADVFGADAVGRGQFNVALVDLNRKAAASTTAQLEALAADPAAPAFPVDEATLAHFASQHPDATFNAFTPSKGTARFDYPLLRRTADVKSTEEAVTALRTVMSGADSRAAVHAAGLRSSANDTTTPAGITTTPGNAAPVYAAAPDVDVMNRAMTAWLRAGTDARQLVVFDVSGSMKAETGAGTRIDLASEAARQALATYPDSSAMGLWVFSQWRGPNREDYLSLAPVLPLSDQMGEVTQRESLDGLLKSLSTLPRGGTGLYDTVLAAYTEVQRTWDPQRTNALVLLTDGRNEDRRGTTLPDLIATLVKQRDPAKPIAVSLVGISSDADGKVLRQIAKAVGGRAYYAAEPGQIKSVFIDALLARPRAQR